MANGDRGIDQLPSGQWRVRVMGGTYIDAHGKTKRRRVSKVLPKGATKTDARNELAEIRLSLGKTTGEADRMTVGELVRRWIDSGEKRRSPASQYKYNGIAKNWIIGHPIAAMSISDVRTGHLNEHYDRILSNEPPGERAPGTVGIDTVQQVSGMLTGSFKLAVSYGWILANPGRATDELKRDKKPDVIAATPEQIRDAVSRAEDIQPGLSSYIHFMAVTGCRRSEALALRWDRIAGDVVELSESISVIPGTGLTVKGTKTGKARWVSVNASLLEALKGLKAAQVEVCAAAGITHRDDMLCWSKNMLGEEPWRPDTAGKWVTKTGITPVQLRHAVATELLAAGVPINAVAARLGHDKTSTTTDTYAEALAAEDRLGADIMSDRLGL